MHRALRVKPAEERHVGERRAGALERAFRNTDEVRQADLVEPLLHRGRVGDVEEPVAAVHVDAAARGHLHLERERAVGDRVRREQLVGGRVALQKHRHRTVAEVEHEPRALVLVVEEVRLSRGTDEQETPQAVVPDQVVAREPQRHRAAARDVGVLERERVHAAEPVRDPRRGLPDRVVAPHRAEVDDGVDARGIDAALLEQATLRP